MEHIFFEVQVCIKISILQRKTRFRYTDLPTFTQKPPIPACVPREKTNIISKAISRGRLRM